MVTRFRVGLVGLIAVLALPLPAHAQSETIEYYGLDALGSVRVIFDGQGGVVSRMDYGPFGENLREAIKFPTEQFAQLARDAESGQDYAQARNYLAGTGRFNRVDPVYAGLFIPQAWNRYAYALNNPLAFTDASGQMAQALRGTCFHPGYFAEMRSHCEWWLNFTVYGGGWGGGSGSGGSSEPQGGGGTPGPAAPTGPSPSPGTGPGPGPGPTPPPVPPTPADEGTFGCTARLSSRVSLASIAIHLGASDSRLLQTVGGNDLATVTEFFMDVNWSNAVEVALSNPFPLNLTTQGAIWIGNQRIGPKDTATNVRELPWGAHEVDGWQRRTPISKTIAGKLLGAGLKVASKGKLWYDVATYAGALAYCSAQ